MAKERACKNCKRLIKGNICPICKKSELSAKWKGVVVIFDPENSEIAKKMKITAAGRYTIRVK